MSQCFIFELINPDAEPVHLSAYGGIFNPTNLATNYLGDVGTSSSASTLQSMGITVPAGTSVVFVVNESFFNSVFSSDYTINLYTSDCANVLNTNDSEINSKVKLYPNPTKEVLYIQGIEVKKAVVYDMNGKIISTKVINNVVQTQKLPKGNYILRMNDKDGNTITEKFIKK